MTHSNSSRLIPDEVILNKILLIREHKVMLDSDLADLFDIPTKRLNEQVRRNKQRFPSHFMFQLTEEEKIKVVANCDHLQKLKFSPFLPYAFTEHGVIMLASILNSDRAIRTSIRIVETFVRMRELIKQSEYLALKFNNLETKVSYQDEKIHMIFEILKELEQDRQNCDDNSGRKRIGFKPD
jgi:hypothetical protein